MKQKISLFLILFSSLIGTLSHAQTYPSLFGIQDDKMTWDLSLRSKTSEVGARWVRQYVFLV